MTCKQIIFSCLYVRLKITHSLVSRALLSTGEWTKYRKLFIPLFNFCFWCMLDKSFNETTLPSSDDICFWSSFLFDLTSWKLSPLALWVRYFAEEGIDLTIKQDKLFFNKTQSQWDSPPSKWTYNYHTHLRYGMVVLRIQAYNPKHCTRLPKCSIEIKQIIYYDGLSFSIAEKHHECKLE